jgi:hypothetical protein
MNVVVSGRDRRRALEGLGDVVTRADVEALAETGDGPRVSLFLARHGSSTGVEQDRIAFKNLIGQARQGLERTGSRAPGARELLRPAVELLDDPAAWERPSKGLAVYLSTAGWRGYRLPVQLPTRVDMGPRFHIRPLLPMLTDDGRFYVVALSRNRVRLLVGTRDHIQEISLGRTPVDLDTALAWDELESDRLYHVSVREGVRATVSHGRGIGGEVEKVRLTRFLRLVDDGLAEVLRDERAPLVVAGSDPEPAIFRQITRYPTVLDASLAGNADRDRPEDLHRRAWPFVEPIFRRERIEAAERFRRLAGTGRTAEDIETAVVAAIEGRVDVLFVWSDAERWGSIEPTTGRVTVRRNRRPDDVDLLEITAVRTLLGGGAVYAVPSLGLPDGEDVAAILRY